jgi:EAL domain-containing protein (putative c-di-GMP-specific phosphodiesterase class I)
MSQASRTNSAPVEQLPADLVELEQALAELPAEHRMKVALIFSKVKQSTLRRRRILNLVQDALSQLRLDMKYLMFDLEATRRERDDFRRQLEDV